MAMNFIQSLLLLTLSMVMRVPIVCCSFDGQYVVLSANKFLTQPAIEVLQTNSQELCTARCTMNAVCRAVSFSAVLGTCELYPQNLTVSTSSANDKWNSLIKVSTVEMPSVVRSDYESIGGTMIGSGQADVTYSNYTLTGVASERQCRSMCGLLLSASCNVFSYNSDSRQCVMFAFDFYNTWTSLVRGLSWTSFYRRDVTRQKLVYKATKATLVNVGTTFNNTGFSNSTAVSADMTVGSALGQYRYLKSDILENWSMFPLQSITIKLASAAGAILKFVAINATNTTIETFFNEENILNSSWTDLPGYAGSTAITMTVGLTATYKGRYFQIQTIKDCANDKSWIHVNGLASGDCPFDKAPVPQPQFWYSNLGVLDFSKNGATADNFLVYASL